MTETEAVALAEARNRMPGAGRWFAQRLPDGSWRVVRVLGGTLAAPVAPSAVSPEPPRARPEWAGG